MSKLHYSKVAGTNLGLPMTSRLVSRQTWFLSGVTHSGSRAVVVTLLICCRYYTNESAAVNFHPSTVLFVVWSTATTVLVRLEKPDTGGAPLYENTLVRAVD
jgi:hypothetical protein